MDRLCNWVTSWLEYRRLKALGRGIKQSQAMASKSRKKLDKQLKQLKVVERRLMLISETVVEDVEEARQSQVKLEEALEAATSKIKILEETTIPTLVAQNQLILKRIDAETAIAVRNQVAAMPMERGVEV